MVYRNTSSKKVCGLLGCRWLNFKSKKNIPLEESLKRMLLRRGGTLPEDKVLELKEILDNWDSLDRESKIKKLKALSKFLKH